MNRNYILREWDLWAQKSFFSSDSALIERKK